MFRIAVLISGAGSNFVSLAHAVASGEIPNSEIACVISDKPSAKGLEKAKEMGIPTAVLNKKELGDKISDEILSQLDSYGNIDLVVLAGFLSILEGKIVREYKNKLINIHPSLIPSFCGDGMYGIKVHEAAIEYGVRYSGCTTHFVDEGTDTGAIILQAVVPVTTSSPKALQQDIITEEHKLLVKTVAHFAKGEVKVNGRSVEIIGGWQ